MTTREARLDLALLAVIGLLLVGGVAALQRVPGYMDADYYYAGALRLYQGHGLTEPYLWNYLTGLTQLPVPSHLYWMPLTSLVAAASMALLGGAFWAAQVPFVLLGAGLAPLTYWLGGRFDLDRRGRWMAALLAVLGGYYLVRWGITDAFTLYAWLGTFFALTLAGGLDDPPGLRCLLAAGVFAGLAHLARADGLLFGGVAGLLLVGRRGLARDWRGLLLGAGALALGYLIPMGPWLLRNLTVIGTPLAPGGLSAALLVDYNDLFLFDTPLTLERYLSLGWPAIAQQKLDGLLQSGMSLVAVQGLVLLLPFIALGVWRDRRRAEVQAAVLYEALLFVMMGLVFTLQGGRGGFFHSAAALHPLLMVLAVRGFDVTIEWASQRLPGWEAPRAKLGFGVILTVMAAVLTAAVTLQRLPDWNGRAGLYAELGARIAVEYPDAVLMVSNPPAWYLATGRPAVVTTTGDLGMLWAAVEAYGVSLLLIDRNHAEGLSGLYDNPASIAGLALVGEYETHDAGTLYLFEVAR